MRDSLHSQYLNEFGDRWIFAHGDNTSSALYTADKLADKWSTPTPIFNQTEGIEKANYPFLMADGVTLYFAAKGGNTMGGYDIFMSTFDHDNGVYYSPENIGLPLIPQPTTTSWQSTTLTTLAGLSPIGANLKVRSASTLLCQQLRA